MRRARQVKSTTTRFNGVPRSYDSNMASRPVVAVPGTDHLSHLQNRRGDWDVRGRSSRDMRSPGASVPTFGEGWLSACSPPTRREISRMCPPRLQRHAMTGATTPRRCPSLRRPVVSTLRPLGIR